MIRITDKKDCCGCYACYNVCPLQCISMESDSEGFIYPLVDPDVCSDCGICDTACPILHPFEMNNQPLAYACINRNTEIRKQSSSGGVFTVLAEKVIENQGVVFGAFFDQDFNVVHGWTERLDELYKFRGSKYVQSSVGETYEEARGFLAQGREVLFSGTPCQIAGLQSFLGKDDPGLICVDIICHGVPSPGVWQRYKKEMEQIHRAKVQRITFRRKDSGWKLYSVSLSFDNDTEYVEPLTKDVFMKGFLSNLYLRPSCYSCHFKSLNRHGDITLADFWGIENILPHLDDDKGTSLVLVNSKKGADVFAGLRDNIIFEPVDVEKAIVCNSSAVKSVDYNSKREKFFEELDKAENIIVLIDRYTRVSMPKKAYSRVRGLLGKVKRRVTG